MRYPQDFGLAGLRFGLIHTLNKSLLKCLVVMSNYEILPSLIQDMAAMLLNDKGKPTSLKVN